jgi:hypothetical protein
LELFRALGDAFGIEAETQFQDVVSGGTAKTGDRLVIADVDRFYTCPVCGQGGPLPPADELRRLAKN